MVGRSDYYDQLGFSDLKEEMMTIQIQEFENQTSFATAYAPQGLVCLRCDFEAADFVGFCYHAKRCKIPVRELV